MVVSQIFTSIQGEAHLSGLYQCFVRTAGCSVNCPIRKGCDEQESLKFKNGTQWEVDDLVKEVISRVGKGGWCHITGGEPTEQEDFDDFLKELTRNDIKIQIQTSGVRRIGSRWDWLTVSPKQQPNEISKLVMNSGQELKIINDKNIVPNIDAIIEYYETTKFWDYYLQPLWHEKNGPNIDDTIKIILKCNEKKIPIRLSMQMHKYWGESNYLKNKLLK
jgi:organic radical activating enzyme